MNTIDTDSKVDLLFQLKWKSTQVIHTDCYQATQVNMWRDLLPEVLKDQLMGSQTGDTIVQTFKRGESVRAFDPRDLKKIKRRQFTTSGTDGHAINPQHGRFYPKGILKDVRGVFRDNITPFRCVGINNGNLSVDFNHPLGDKNLLLSTIIGRIEPKRIERGGTSIDWIEQITQGPGMQARWRDTVSDFVTPPAFTRVDSSADTLFLH
jgi:FKBP-type peptidyl-prolyl cis-trans isomerase 2